MTGQNRLLLCLSMTLIRNIEPSGQIGWRVEFAPFKSTTGRPTSSMGQTSRSTFVANEQARVGICARAH